jgi:hypothetical protein
MSFGGRVNDTDIEHVLDQLANVVMSAISSDGVESPIDSDSPLAAETEACTEEIAKHFLGELPHHCTMLISAAADACIALSRLDTDLPFSAVVLVRGLFEAIADLHWLSDARLGHVERVRRTFLVYLRQVETSVRNVESFARRRGSVVQADMDLDEAIRQGREKLLVSAEAMAAAGYTLRSSRKAGSRYYLEKPKPPISELVDGTVSAFYGTTTLNLYSLYSSVAHAEGEGLGTLLIRSDSIVTAEGTRLRRGFSDEEWANRIVTPSFAIMSRGVREWLMLAYPHRLSEYDAATRQLAP